MSLQCTYKAQDELYMGQGRCEDLAKDSLFVNIRIGFIFGPCILGFVEQVFYLGHVLGLRGFLAFEENWTKGELGLKLAQQERECIFVRIQILLAPSLVTKLLVCAQKQVPCDLLRWQVTLASCSLFGSKYHILDPFSLHFSRPLGSPFLL